MAFTVSGMNNGTLVSKDYYIQNDEDKNIGASIVDSALSNGDFGFSVADNVEYMVSAKMGSKIELIQAQITNSNIKSGAYSQFKETISLLTSNTIKPLNQQSALTSYAITNSNPSSIDVSISDNGTGPASALIDVEQLATSHSISIAGFDSKDSIVGEGVINIDFGDYSTGSFEQSGIESLSVSVSGGMTLEDLKNTINDSVDGVSAVIYEKDGKYSLSLMSQNTGQDSAMNISTTGAASLSVFNYNGADTATVESHNSPVDAVFSINNVRQTSASNELTDVLGLNLTLKSVTTGSVSISTKVDPAAISDNIQAMVENYNSVIEMFNSFTQEASDEDFVGSLYGSDGADDIANMIDSMFNTLTYSGISLGELGISRDSDGKMELDAEALVAAINQNPTIAFDTLGTNKTSSSSSVSISDIGPLTEGGYSLVINRNAEKALFEGGVVGSPVTLGADTEIQMKVGAKDVTFSISAGTYSAKELSAIIGSELRSQGVDSLNISTKGDALTFESKEYGSLQSIEFLNDIPELGITAEKVTGKDVSGTINGEAFLGDGNVFTSNLDDSTKGMVITTSPESTPVGSEISLSVSKGFLDKLSEELTEVSDLISEEVADLKNDLDSTLSTSLVTELEDLYSREEYYFNLYYSQFSTVSSQLAQFNSVSTMLDAMFFQSDD